MDLAELHQRLSTHFAGLAQARANDQSVFALEHGLSAGEVATLSHEIRASIVRGKPKSEHALAWVAYAAEVGYRYAGDEYWQTFEQETPRWTVHGDRGWIRDAFVRFYSLYKGARPSGAWATQFSIIAWPITHAILPRDLQQQLARILYAMRHSFSAELLASPELLGQFIAASSWNASKRFQNLAQQPALLGQIAVALLMQDTDGAGLLHPLTLRRIGEDVDRERRGRTWLQAARSHVEQRAQVRGLPSTKPTRPRGEEREGARAEVIALGIEPQIVLRPVDGKTRWEVSLKIPDLSHLLVRFPQARDVLVESRCTVTGASGRPLAGGRFLHGAQNVVLSRWPRSDELLLKFEQSDPQLDYLLHTECLIRPGTLWLFRIASDGIAYESRGRRARAGQKYIVVTTDGPISSELAISLELGCEGVFGAMLELPAALTPEWEVLLRRLKVGQAKAIEVWPAGLDAVTWDDEGSGEWLVSESPTFAIRTDHALDHLLISMDDGAAPLGIDMSVAPPGEPIFVELPGLSVGMHQFSIIARKGTTVVGDVSVGMRVREARAWSPGANARGPLDMDVEPAAPTIEDLWEGRASIRVSGPQNRTLHGRVSMFNRLDADTPIFEHQLEDIALPMDEDDWRRQLDGVRGLPPAQNAYDGARLCEIEFSADELGTLTLRYEREFAPLRWSLRRETSGFVSHLHRDVEESAMPHLERFPFDRPATPERLLIRADSDYAAPRTGGLYRATVAGFVASLIVPPVVRDFHDLKLEVRIDVDGSSREAIMRCLDAASIWSSARLAGDIISAQRSRFVQRSITSKLASIVGGVAWSEAEASIGDGHDGLVGLKRGISSKPQERGVGAKLDLDREALAKASVASRVDAVASLADRFKLIHSGNSTGSDGPKWLAEFALRFMSAPASLPAWAGGNLLTGIDRLLDAPTYVRAARFLVLAVERELVGQRGTRGLYAGWEWGT